MRLFLAWLGLAGTVCRNCNHGRTQHSRNGCTSCSCTVKYMDKDMFA